MHLGFLLCKDTLQDAKMLLKYPWIWGVTVFLGSHSSVSTGLPMAGNGKIHIDNMDLTC